MLNRLKNEANIACTENGAVTNARTLSISLSSGVTMIRYSHARKTECGGVGINVCILGSGEALFI